jgi:hypothetical protein
MSTAAAIPAWEAAFETTTVKQFGKALAVALAALLAGCGLYGLEKYAFRSEERFIQNPADVMMRAFAIAHFLVGMLYLFTSPRIRNRGALTRVGIATLAGLGICWLFAQFDSTRNPFLVMFFYGYFLVHEIRDETQIYQAYGDGPGSAAEHQAILRTLSGAVCLGMMAVLAIAYVTHIEITAKRTALERAPEWLVPGAISLVLAASVFMLWRLRALARQAGSSLRGVLTAHMPLLLVFGGILGVLLLGSPFGSTGLNLIILVHVTAWLVFVHYQLAKKPATPPLPPLARGSWGGLWGWLRGTPTGFLVLHLGVMAVILILMAVRVHVWQRVGFVSELLASKTFTYWGLMHISMSFWSSK